MKSRVTPNSLPTLEIRSSWIRIAILSGVRTRNGSLSFVLAFAKEPAPRLIVINIDAIRNAEIFLSIFHLNNPARFLARSLFQSLCLGRFLDALRRWKVCGPPTSYSWSQRLLGGSQSVSLLAFVIVLFGVDGPDV